MGRSHQERNKKMIAIKDSKPTEGEIKDAIKYLTEMLEKMPESDDTKNARTDGKDIGYYKLKGRLDRQGKDIFILWNKVDNLEKQIFRMINER